MNGKERERWQHQLANLLKESQEAGFTASETIDFLAVRVCDIDVDEWADLRGVFDVTVEDHVETAWKKVDQSEEKQPDDEEDDGLRADGGTDECELCGGEGEVLGPGPDVHQCPECGAGQGQTSAEQWDPSEDPHACSTCGQPLGEIKRIEGEEHCDACLREYGLKTPRGGRHV